MGNKLFSRSGNLARFTLGAEAIHVRHVLREDSEIHSFDKIASNLTPHDEILTFESTSRCDGSDYIWKARESHVSMTTTHLSCLFGAIGCSLGSPGFEAAHEHVHVGEGAVISLLFQVSEGAVDGGYGVGSEDVSVGFRD